MRYSLLHGAFLAALLGLFIALPASADYVGLDADADLSCGETEMAFEGTDGELRSFDIFIEDLPSVLSVGCVFCVKDKTTITGDAWTYNLPTGWTAIAIDNSENPGFPIVVSDFITTNYTDYKCWMIQGTDFTFSNPISSYPYVLGTFQYEVAQDGCIGFVIDGPNAGWLSMGMSGTFGDPGETCDTSFCATVDPLVIDDQDPACPLPDALFNEPYGPVQFTATGGVPPYQWSQSGLPEGMNIDNDGNVSGAPTEAGPFPFIITVEDAQMNPAERACSLFVESLGVFIELLTTDYYHVAPGDSITHEIRVTNTGNTQQPIALHALSSQAWPIEVLGTDQFPLDPGADATREVGYKVPDDLTCPPAKADYGDDLLFRAKAGDVTAAFDSVTALVEVSFSGAVTALFNDDHVCADPGMTAGFVIRVENHGDCPDVFDLSFNPLDLPWVSRIVGDNPVSIDDGLGRNITVEVDVPADAPCADIQRYEFLITGQQFGASAADTAKACAMPVYDGALSDPGNGFGEPGDPVEYCFIIENTGNCTAYYRIEFNAGWETSIPLYVIGNLDADQKDTVCVDHVIPGGAPNGDSDSLCAVLLKTTAGETILDTSCVVTTVQTACQGGVLVEAWTNGLCHDPGGQFQAMFDVINTGTCEEVFALGAGVDDPDWTAGPAVPTVQIPAGETTAVAVDVTVAPDALCGEVAEVTLAATGQSYGATGDDTAYECVNAILTGTVSDEGDQGGLPGETITYCFQIVNTGNCNTRYTLGASAVPGWDWSPEGHAVVLLPGEDATVCFDHVIPGDADPGAQEEVCLLLHSSENIPLPNGDPIDTTCVVTTVLDEPCDAGVDVFADPTTIHGDPMQLLQHHFQVVNTGQDPDRYFLMVSDDAGWNPVIEGPDTTAVAAPGETLHVTVRTGIPAGTPCGTVATTELVAFSECNPSVWDSAYARIIVDPVCSFTVVAQTADSTGAPDQLMEYLFEITNSGNCPFTPFLWLTEDPVWGAGFPSLPPELDPDETFVLPVTIRIPSDAQQGDEQTVFVCVDCAVGKVGDQRRETCDSTITRVITDCQQGQPVLSLGGYQTLDYTFPLWTVQVEVKNNGPGEARNVNLDMHEEIDWLTIQDDGAFYGDIGQGSSSFGNPADPFVFDLTGYPGGSFNIWFDVTYTDTCGTPFQVRLDPSFLDPNGEGVPAAAPEHFVLHQNVPNPFNPTTTISFELPDAGYAELTIFNTAGQVVRRLWRGNLPAGAHEQIWRGESDRGTSVPSGTYFFSLKSGGLTETKRMVLIR